MRATAVRPNAKLLTIAHAAQEYGLPARLLRELIVRGDLAIQPPNIRRVFVLRADLERKLEVWRVRGEL